MELIRRFIDSDQNDSQNTIDQLNQLPIDILIEILSKLKLVDLFQLCQINQRISHLCQDDRFWRFKLFQDFPQVPLPIPGTAKRIYMDHYRLLGRAKMFTIKYGITSRLTSIIDQLKEEGIKRGDIVHIKYQRHYTLDIMVIYDGTRLRPFFADPYSVIPIEFEVIEEFSIRHWSNIPQLPIIYVPFNLNRYAKQIRQNFQPIITTIPQFHLIPLENL